MDLFSRQGFACSHRIIFCMDRQEWNPDGKQRVYRRCIAIIGSFGWVAPCWSLHMSVEFVKILDLPDNVHIDLGVGGDLVNMTADKKLVRRRY